jgi:hypothetical protein
MISNDVYNRIGGQSFVQKIRDAKDYLTSKITKVFNDVIALLKGAYDQMALWANNAKNYVWTTVPPKPPIEVVEDIPIMTSNTTLVEDTSQINPEPGRTSPAKEVENNATGGGAPEVKAEGATTGGAPATTASSPQPPGDDATATAKEDDKKVTTAKTSKGRRKILGSGGLASQLLHNMSFRGNVNPTSTDKKTDG